MSDISKATMQMDKIVLVIIVEEINISSSNEQHNAFFYALKYKLPGLERRMVKGMDIR